MNIFGESNLLLVALVWHTSSWKAIFNGLILQWNWWCHLHIVYIWIAISRWWSVHFFCGCVYTCVGDVATHGLPEGAVHLSVVGCFDGCSTVCLLFSILMDWRTCWLFASWVSLCVFIVLRDLRYTPLMTLRRYRHYSAGTLIPERSPFLSLAHSLFAVEVRLGVAYGIFVLHHQVFLFDYCVASPEFSYRNVSDTFSLTATKRFPLWR